MTKIIIAIVLIMGIAVGAVAYGKNKFDKFEDPAARLQYMTDRISKKLELDDQQRHKLMALKDEIEGARLMLHNRNGSARSEIKNLIAAETFDRTKVIEMINHKTATVNEVAPGIVTALGDFHDSLSAEQKAEMAELVSRKHFKRGYHRHM